MRILVFLAAAFLCACHAESSHAPTAADNSSDTPAPQLVVGLDVPTVTMKYSYGLDMLCPHKVEPEVLNTSQQDLIPQLPQFRKELLANLNLFQAEWDTQGIPLLKAALQEIQKPFPMKDLEVSLELCPRYWSMGTPVVLNVISYLNSSARLMPPLAGKPMPLFFFVSTAFHEILHKYIDSILKTQPSRILESYALRSDLLKSHLHLFALQRKTFESLQLSHLLPGIQQLEALHGADYEAAWNEVHSNNEVYERLLKELR